MSPPEIIADCPGRHAAEELLAVSREIVARGTNAADTIKAAAASIDVALKLLDRCQECEASVAAGGEPLC